MEHQLKSISKSGIPEAIAKVELYRYLNEPEEAESICRDILAVDPEHQLARRMLGLAITDQFIGAASDRYIEVQSIFQGLRDPYEQFYYTGLLHERHAKTQLMVGYAPHTLLPLAMTTVFSAGIVASDYWKAGPTFISSADPQLLIRRICRPSVRQGAAAAITESKAIS